MELINKYRLENGVNELTTSTNLVESSKNHLEYLAKKGVISHKGDGGSTLKKRIDESGVSGLNFGEVVGYSGSNYELVESWKDSYSHNLVLLDRKWNFIGVSVISVGDRRVSVVNFSSGLLGSTTINKIGGVIIVSGEYIDEVKFESRVSYKTIFFKNGAFKFELPEQKIGFFIKAYNKEGKLTDRLNIF